ncbi:hypothetical protein PLICRDRAFT_172748 [Plicaturopsis crispa FD-325 SS-3]|nr:hypothetical protein PLICRDRAFT_172748 [Plicaturopsis crispa FD-325 SS-3]
MGETFTNFLGGSPLNRLSWLRPSHSFLNAVIVSPATRWILFNAGQPLLATHPETRKRSLAQLTTDDVRPLLGPAPFFGQTNDESAVAEPNVPVLEASRHRGAPVVFLGLQEPQDGTAAALPSSDFADPHAAVANLSGTPFFSLDVAGWAEEETVDAVLKASSAAKEGQELAWTEARGAMTGLDAFTAGVFANARSLVDWNSRNKFCPACGTPTYSMWAGWKIACRSLLPWADNTGRKPCPTERGLHNFTHPRTDPVVIMVAVDDATDKILLGRNKKFPGKFYSALAGFMEPGESFEDAVKREMWEEAGVKVWDIRYHSGQPWPYPANLMVGFYARADPSQPVRVDLDNELEDAQWFTRAEVLKVLNHKSGTNFTRKDYKTMEEITEGRSNTVANASQREEIAAKAAAEDEPPFRVPPLTAIAGVLIRDWAEGKIGFGPNMTSDARPPDARHRRSPRQPAQRDLSPAQSIAEAWKRESEENQEKWRQAEAKVKQRYETRSGRKKGLGTKL